MVHRGQLRTGFAVALSCHFLLAFAPAGKYPTPCAAASVSTALSQGGGTAARPDPYVVPGGNAHVSIELVC